jgi:hypothetical protein
MTGDLLAGRFVWGVRPTDNGNHFNPGDKGQLFKDSVSREEHHLNKFVDVLDFFVKLVIMTLDQTLSLRTHYFRLKAR